MYLNKISYLNTVTSVATMKSRVEIQLPCSIVTGVEKQLFDQWLLAERAYEEAARGKPFFSFVCFVLQDKVSLYNSSSCPGTHSADHWT